MTDAEAPVTSRQPTPAGPAGPAGPADPEVAEHRERPSSAAFKKFIAAGWAPRPTEPAGPAPAAPFAARRRAALSARVPRRAAGRSRPGCCASAATTPTTGSGRTRPSRTSPGWAPTASRTPSSCSSRSRRRDLTARPATAGCCAGHDAVLYFRPRAERDTEEFYANARYGELWVGVRPEPGRGRRRDRAGLPPSRRAGRGAGQGPRDRPGAVPIRMVRGADARVEAIVARLRPPAPDDPATPTTRRTPSRRPRPPPRPPTPSWPGPCPSCGWSRTTTRSSSCGWPSR